MQLFGALADDLFVAQQHRAGDVLVDQNLRGAQYLILVAFGEDHSLRVALRLVDDHAHDLLRLAEAALQGFAILVGMEPDLGHAGLHRSARHGRRDAGQHARVEGLGDDVIRAEFHRFHTVGAAHGIRHVLASEFRQGERSREHHLLIDGGGADIQRSAEDEREAEHVVHLVRIIRAPRGHQQVLARRYRQFVVDLRIGIGERKDDRTGRHDQQHLWRDAIGDRQADKHVGAPHGVGERARLGLANKFVLVLVDALGAAGVQYALAVAHQDVFELRSEPDVMVRARDCAGACAGKDDPHIAQLLTDDLHGVDQSGAGDDGGAMLVVVEDGDVHGALQLFLNLEALWGLDVFEIDAAEGGLHQLACTYDFFGVEGVQLDIEDVDVGEAFEQNALALHHGLAGGGADVAEPEHGGAVGDHGHEVALGRVVINERRISMDLQARHGDARCVGQAQVALGPARLGGRDGYLARRLGRVVTQRFFFAIQHEWVLPAFFLLPIGGNRNTIPAVFVLIGKMLDADYWIVVGGVARALRRAWRSALVHGRHCHGRRRLKPTLRALRNPPATD